MIRVRILYNKSGDLIYTSNLDIQKIWERAARRAGLSHAYSAGFHPQARIQQACPLPLGFFSEEEIVDIWFIKRYSIKSLQEKINTSLPSGIQIKSCKEIELTSPAMQKIVFAADYEVFVFENVKHSGIRNKIDFLMNSKALQFEKRGKTFNLRTRINNIDVISKECISPVILHMNLKHLSNANGRPDDVLTALGLNPLGARIIRKKINY